MLNKLITFSVFCVNLIQVGYADDGHRDINIWELLRYAGIGLAISLAVVILAKCCLCMCGFRSGGVRAGSCAACCQGPDTESGSLFAHSQSAGAKGCSICLWLVFVIIGIAVGIAVYFIVLYHPAGDDGPYVPPSNTTTVHPNTTVTVNY